MNSREILTCLKSDNNIKQQLLGVFPRDKLPKIVLLPAALVVNSDPATKPGMHWLSIYISPDGKGEYFDSYGLRPWLPSIIKYLNKNCKDWMWSSVRLQAPYSSVCGQYCIFFLHHRCKGYTMSEITNQFSNNLVDNDTMVCQFVNKTYNVDTE